MKFKLDENLLGEGVQILRAAGHDAVTVLDQRLGVIAEVAAAAVDEPVTGKLWIVEDGRLRIRG